MIDRLTAWLYARLGSRYLLVLILGQGGVSVGVTVLTLGLISLYYDASVTEVAVLVSTGAVLALIAVGWADWKTRAQFREVVAWSSGERTAAGTVAAWHAATTLVLATYRRSSGWVNLAVVTPSVALAAWLLELGPGDVVVLLLAAAVPAIYATFLSYSTGETLVRPMVADIARHLPDDFPFERDGVPLSVRISVGLPAYTVGSGLLVAVALGERNGSASLLVAVLVATGIGVALSMELAHLLTRSITQPLDDVRKAMEAVRGGDLAVRAPVLTSDEMGALAHDFNRMAHGLQEREEMRAAFGTYVDKAVVELILSGQFPPEGVEVDVSILFLDIKGFTSYAERAAATEVVGVLNHIFELVVPIIEAHGGHVDKFIGDGLLAVFGAPELFVDHADRAVAAACETVTAVRSANLGLEVAAGVNSGMVVAGSVGGAGRFNFSVIGDAVNVAARVEAATRSTGDDVLVTADTRSRMSDISELVSRGSIPLKGKSEPLELFAPGPVAEAVATPVPPG